MSQGFSYNQSQISPGLSPGNIASYTGLEYERELRNVNASPQSIKTDKYVPAAAAVSEHDSMDEMQLIRQKTPQEVSKAKVLN